VAHSTLTERRPYWNADAEAADPAELRRRDDALLVDQLVRTDATSAFYRDKWKNSGVSLHRIRAAVNLDLLPFTEKAELQEALAAAPPFGTNVSAPPNDMVRMQATGGTTGTPLRMAMTRSDISVYNEIGARAAWAAGLRPGDILFECMNYSLYAGGVNDHGTFETLGACVAAIGVGQSRRLLEIIGDLGVPGVLYSTPSYALHLAAVARELGLTPGDLGLRRGLFSGDAGLENPTYRREIESTWGMVARSIYGTSETAPVAAECDEADGMHWLGQGAFLAEFIDPVTERVIAAGDGVTAELVITTIKREAHPLIRFRTHDLVRLTTTPCPCGRTSVRFHVLGRGDDMLIVRGINLFPLAIASVVDEFRPEVSGEFRIVVDQPPPLTDPPRLLVEAAPDVPAERWQSLGAAIADRIRTVQMVTLAVDVVAAGTYPRTESKTRRVVHAWRGESAS
jgi:phenylacetate-CoA ligase